MKSALHDFSLLNIVSLLRYKVCMNEWSVENGNSMCQQMGFLGVRGFSSPIPVDEPDQTIVKYRTFASCKGEFL